jgi:outer membrane protein assembly factor BamB
MTAGALGETASQQTPAREATLTQVWSLPPATYEEKPQPTLEVIPADLDGDGVDEILAIRGRYLTCIDAAGRVMWEFDGTDELYAACAWDIDGDGAQEVFCGGKSKLLYVLEPDGTLIREHPIETYWRVSRTTIHEPRLDDVLVMDFDGDGNWEAVLGTVDGFTQGIDRDFKQLWIYGETNHGTTEMQAVDVDGDGTLEVAVGNRYGKLFVFDALTGKVRTRVTSELGDVQMAVADLDGDGVFEALNGSATGVFKCGRVGSREVAWEFPNYGYAFRDIKIADVAASPGLEPIIASDTGYVYVLAADGATLASRDLGAATLDLAVDGDTIAAGCLDGSVYLLDGALEEIGFGSLPARVNSVIFCRTDEGAALVAGSEDGSVAMLSR